MYIPKAFLVTDRTEMIAFMQQYSFATIVTAKNELPIATRLPFTISTKGDTIILTAHFAKANEQWKDIAGNTVMVIFSEPHAYISPKHYDQELSVPTWNYIAVHAYGNGKIIIDQKKTFKVLETMIDQYDKAYRKQWDGLPFDFKSKMLNGIVPFEIRVTELQAKQKLSQNKTAVERQKIIDTLSKSENKTETAIAVYMTGKK